MISNDSSSSDVVHFQWVAIISLFLMAMFGGILPLKIRTMASSNTILSLGNMFSGGVFLGGGLLHLLPESNEDLTFVLSGSCDSNNVEDGGCIDIVWLRDFPLAFFLCGLGFFCILLVEEIAISSANKQDIKEPSIAEVEKQIKKVKAKRKKLKKQQQEQQREFMIDSPYLSTPQLRRREFLKLYYTKKKSI